MRYFLITTILSLLFFSSFKTVQPEGVADAQLVLSDSCRISRVYLNDKLHTMYRYDSMNNIIRIDYYRKVYRAKGMVLIDYSDFEYDELNRMVSHSRYMSSRNLVVNREYNLWMYDEFKYEENSNLIKEKWYYNIDKEVGMAEYKPSNIDEYFYNSKNQLIKIQEEKVKKKRRRKKRYGRWLEFKYDDNNNPIEILFYSLNKKGMSILSSINERKYDSYPNMLSKIQHARVIPLGNNNIVWEKRTHKDLKEDSQIPREYITKYDYEYNDQGFIKSKRIVKNDEISFFKYEYTCD